MIPSEKENKSITSWVDENPGGYMKRVPRRRRIQGRFRIKTKRIINLKKEIKWQMF
jgi:hypothetical protein